MNRQLNKLALTGGVLLVLGGVLQGCADRRYEYGSGASVTNTRTHSTQPVQVQSTARTVVTATPATITTQRVRVPAPPRAARVATTVPKTATTTVVSQPRVATATTQNSQTAQTTTTTVTTTTRQTDVNSDIKRTIADSPELRRNRNGQILVGASNGSDPIGAIVGRPVIAVDVVPQDVAKKLEEYRMGPGDRLQIKVFGQDDISGEFEISAAGELSYPLIGQITAENMTPGEFNILLVEALKEFFVNPQVTVEITNYRPFFILGQVGNPGSYKYQPGLNARMAIAIGGGYTRRASEEPITIFRSNSAGELIKFDADQDSIILPGDTVEVHRRLF